MMAGVTLLLARSDLEQVLDVSGCLEDLWQGFLAVPSGISAQRVRTDLPGPGTATALIPGLAVGIPAYTVKVNAKFPGSRPALRGVVCLHDATTGELLAMLDSATVTAWRTGLAAALGTHVLARPDARAVAVIGAGTQAELVVRGLAALRAWERLTVCDLDPAQAALFAGRHATTPSAAVTADSRAAARDADIVVLATWIVDDVPLALTAGALGAAGLTAADTASTLSEVLRGMAPGRRGDDEVTIYTPVGLPWQDLVLAWAAYRRALAEGLGTGFDFLT